MSESIACKVIRLITGLTKAEHREKSEDASLYASVLTLLPYTSPQLNPPEASQCSVCDVESYSAGKR